ncbi:hypothetical protein SEUCBS139899_000017 [Sporothrix eucalyptigena]|uniref:Uncharacterized protein n=1 Tax=Sporothrix eucalyptigena TaxID=1812306 RepID=A0ABP0AQY5_9PEZI
MGSSSTASPSTISAETFAELLGRYPDVIAAVSESKGVKPGQKSLVELDAFRYKTAPSIFGRPDGRPMVQEDVLTLVSWKLRHGKFRPTLMKLVESNSPAVVKKTVEDAVKAYRSTADKKKGVEAALDAVKILSTLKGIGPATASLLAAVHFPKECIFFSDEAYAWLCGGASHSAPSKYNAKEYEEVARGMVKLLQRLPDEYGAQDVEQVAYVVMHDKKTQPAARDANMKDTKATATAKAPKKEAAPAKLPVPTQGIDTKRVKSPAGALFRDTIMAEETKKRKEPPAEELASSSNGSRRSSRLKRS